MKSEMSYLLLCGHRGSFRDKYFLVVAKTMPRVRKEVDYFLPQLVFRSLGEFE